MRVRPGSAGVALLIAASVAALAPVALPTVSEAQEARRTADGKPDLNGIWQALNTANWDLQDHPARAGAMALDRPHVEDNEGDILFAVPVECQEVVCRCCQETRSR